MRRRPFLAALLPAGFARHDGAALASPPPSTTSPSTTPGSVPASSPQPIAPAADPLGQPAPSLEVAPLGITHRALRFPADHGSHPDTHVEWWYVTGWLRTATAADPASTAANSGTTIHPDAAIDSTLARPPEFGFQVTFFRTRTDLADTSPSRFAARQLVFAHVALTTLATATKGGGAGLVLDQRSAREGFGLVRTPTAGGTQTVQLRDWSLSRSAVTGPIAAAHANPGAGTATALRIDVRSDAFALNLALQGTQGLLLQGDAGYSRKGPDPRQASHYYSEPQLAVRGRVERAGAPPRDVVGRAWLDHEWSNELLPPQAVGWDWVGFNLADGGALMAFRLRRADGSALWAGGSFRDAAGALRIFAPAEVAFRPLRRWKSPRTQADYPVEWQLDTPAGSLRVSALLDDQELDGRSSTGSVYWEGLCALRHADGRTLGWGYLELTGYADRLRL